LKTSSLGLLLIVAGLLITLTAVLTAASSPGWSAGFAGCIIILVIPICWGIGGEQVLPILAVLAAILAVIAAVNLALAYRARKHFKPDNPS